MQQSSRAGQMTATCDRLHCLLLGWELCPESVSLEGGTRATVLRLPIIGILAHSAAGWFLLETGCDPRPYRGVTTHDIYRVGLPEFPTDGDPLLDALDAHGLTLDDLAGAAVSHLHLDHSGGLHHLAGRVPVTIQARELDFATQRAGRAEAYVREEYERDDLTWRTIDGDAEIAPGIDAVFTPGHTPGHMSYRVRMERSGTWLFAVDAIDLAQGIREDRPIGYASDPADDALRRTSHDRLVALAAEEDARLVPGHCPETWPPLAAVEEGYE
jgi:glyoxylase-like metal-dependent hydrolase (beta-lactamase superfamily II)